MKRAIPSIVLVVAVFVLGSPRVADAQTEMTAAPTDFARFEVSVYPALQLNGEFTQQLGVGAEATWRVNEPFAIQARFYKRASTWLTVEGSMIANRTTEEEDTPTGVHEWAALIGPELSPLRGEGIAFGAPARIQIVFGGGVGAAGTQHGFLGGREARRWLDTGVHFAAGYGIGGRVQVGRFLLRLEVTDVLSPGSAATVEGCSPEDLERFDGQVRRGEAIQGPASGGCDVDFFAANPERAPEAANLTRVDEPWRHTTSAHLGFGVVF